MMTTSTRPYGRRQCRDANEQGRHPTPVMHRSIVRRLPLPWSGVVRRKLVIVALIGVAFSPRAAGQPLQLMPRVTYEHRLSWTTAGPLSLYVIRAPRPGGLYSLAPLLSNETVTGREKVTSMERRASAQMTTIGVNGDFFNWNGGWPSGLLMRGGVLEHHPATRRSAVGIDSAGNLHVDQLPWIATWRGVSSLSYPIGPLNEPPKADSTALFTPSWGATTPPVSGVAAVLEPFPPAAPFRDLAGQVTAVVSGGSVAIPRDGAVLVGRGSAGQALLDDAPVGGQLTVRLALRKDWSSVTDAVGGGPALVRDGKPIFNAGEALTRAQLVGRDPRTAIGQRADGGIVIVAADGRRRGWSIGISNWELALTLIRYGCVTGFALDSGGSTTVAFDGRLLNRPSDTYGERPVAEALVIGYAGVYAPSPAPTLSPNGDGLGERETLSYKLIRPSAVSVKLTGPDGAVRELDAGQKPAGRYRLTWDGTTVDGAAAPEGRWRFSIDATDDLSRTSSAQRTFTVDRTLGFARVRPRALRHGPLTVRFMLTRPAAIRVSIETPSGDILRTIAAGRRAAGRVNVRWNGRDGRRKLVPSGSYVVRVSSSSQVGLSQLRLALRIRRR
jgi:flagellar hook assembly protein FlgD